ncbi:uncharacterized protein [Aristolochia californica]|uniref:uncharacterized protein n=1 Tax=Aristolochia californica TaxID=171875 RepID=UPI0035DB39EA
MAFSAAAVAFLYHGALSSYAPTKLYYPRFNWGHRVLVIGGTARRNIQIPHKIRSVLDKPKSNIGSSDNEALDPARILLERLFAQTQKLEEHMNKNSHVSENEKFCVNLEVLESDLQAALTSLRKKEEDLRDAEKKVLQDHTELDRAKQELEQTKKEIASAYAKHEKMEEELKKANDDLLSRARQIEDLKLLVEEQDLELKSARSALLVKEDELCKLRNELVIKEAEAAQIATDLNSRDRLLVEANHIIKNQEVKLQELHELLEEKECELAESMELRKIEEEKLKLVEANLEKRTVEWLSSREELKRLAEAASKNMAETEETMRYFKRVRSLLADVKSELISSQNSLASSCKKMEEQEEQLQGEIKEVNELKLAVTSYTTTLQDTQLELESERTKLKFEEARVNELEVQISAEKELVRQLEEELNKERSSLEEATQVKVLLQKELEQKSQEFSEIQSLLQVKESELVDARLEIQHLKSEQASFQLSLEEKDINLLSAQKKLEEVNCEISELKKLMTGREDQLIQATEKLKESETSLHTARCQLDDTKMKYSKVVSIVERITQLTNQLVISGKDEEDNYSLEYSEEENFLLTKFEQQLWRERQLELELEKIKDQLRVKEKESMAAERALACKAEELKSVLHRLDMREKETNKVKEEMDGLEKLYELAQERIGGNSIEDLAIEKLRLEAAQLEAEAATTALCNLANLSQELLKQTNITLDLDGNDDADISLKEEGINKGLKMDLCFEVAKKEVFHLSAMTEQFVKEAGIISTLN